MTVFHGVKILETQHDILEQLEFESMEEVYTYLDNSPDEMIAILLATVLYQNEQLRNLSDAPEDYDEGYLHDE